MMKSILSILGNIFDIISQMKEYYSFIASWQQWLQFRERVGEILHTLEMLPRCICSRGQSTKHRQAGIRDKGSFIVSHSAAQHD